MSRGGGDYRDAFRSTGTYAEQETGERAFVAGHSVPLRAFIDAFMMKEDYCGDGDGDGGTEETTTKRGRGGGGAAATATATGGAPVGVTAYLAQHDLLTQIPELSDACSPMPTYVGVGLPDQDHDHDHDHGGRSEDENENENVATAAAAAAAASAMRRVWLGPAG